MLAVMPVLSFRLCSLSVAMGGLPRAGRGGRSTFSEDSAVAVVAFDEAYMRPGLKWCRLRSG